MKKILLLLVFAIFTSSSFSQEDIISAELKFDNTIEWLSPLTFKGFDDKSINLLQFANCTFDFPNDSLPIYSQTSYLPAGSNNAVVKVKVLKSEPLKTCTGLPRSIFK